MVFVFTTGFVIGWSIYVFNEDLPVSIDWIFAAIDWRAFVCNRRGLPSFSCFYRFFCFRGSSECKNEKERSKWVDNLRSGWWKKKEEKTIVKDENPVVPTNWFTSTAVLDLWTSHWPRDFELLDSLPGERGTRFFSPFFFLFFRSRNKKEGGRLPPPHCPDGRCCHLFSETFLTNCRL